MPTPDDMLTAVSDSLATRTGRSLEQWLALVRSCGVDPLDQSAVQNWLRRAERLIPAAPVVGSTVTHAADDHRAIFA